MSGSQSVSLVLPSLPAVTGTLLGRWEYQAVSMRVGAGQRGSCGGGGGGQASWLHTPVHKEAVAALTSGLGLA